jgi:uncharacterized protein YndB with AHSA1/START domain
MTDMTEHTLILHRVLKAPRMRVYECWTDPKHMPHWFMPKPHYVSDIEIDLRPGGIYRSTMHVDGNVIPSVGCVLDAIPGRRFAFTNMMGPDWQPLTGIDMPFAATIDLSDADGGGTAYHVTARHPTAEISAQHDAMGFTVGWGMVADQLDAYAQSLG